MNERPEGMDDTETPEPAIRRVVRIESSSKATSATKVLLDDGSELKGILRIELVAVPGDVWRAQIDLLPDSLALLAEADISAAPLPEVEAGVIEVTAVGDADRRFVPAAPEEREG